MKSGKLAVVSTASAIVLNMLLLAPAQAFTDEIIAKRMQNADKNKDGLISREEAKSMPRLEKNFDAIDTNKDNQLSQEELLAFRAKSKK
jgi:EF hand